MAVLTQANRSVLEELVRRVMAMDLELEALTEERDALRREVEGYRTVLHLAVTQLRDLTLRQQSGGVA